MSKCIKVVVAIILCFYTSSFGTNAATTCQKVATSMAPCRSYLLKGGNVPNGCCDGVRSLNKSATTTALKRAYCECLKSSAKANGVNAQFAAALPDKCGVNIGYPISFNTNCNSIK